MKIVARFSTDCMREDLVEEICNWVRGLGVEPTNVRDKAAIAMGETSYELHLSEYVRDEAGRTRLDHAIDEIVSKPLVVDLGDIPLWPAWLTVAPE